MEERRGVNGYKDTIKGRGLSPAFLPAEKKDLYKMSICNRNTIFVIITLDFATRCGSCQYERI